MPEITKYLSAGLGIEVRVAEPFIKIKNHEAIRMDTPAIFFANVIGLALQSIDERSAGINLLTQYRNNEDKDKQSTLSWHDVQTIDDGKYFVYGCFTRAKETATTLCKKLPIKFNIRLLLTTIFLVATAAFFVWVVAKYT
jgi:hypothetical protein